MATYQELIQAAENLALNQRVRVACIVAAEEVRIEAPATANHANRLKWAASVFANPEAEQQRMLWVVLAHNRAATYAQLIGADDATVQSAVDAVIDIFAQG